MREHLVVGLFPVLFLAILVSAAVANDEIAREKFNGYVTQITASRSDGARATVQSANPTNLVRINSTIEPSESALELDIAGNRWTNHGTEVNSPCGEQTRYQIRLMGTGNTCTGDQQRDRDRHQNRDRESTGAGISNENRNGGNSSGNGYGNRQRNENAFRGGFNDDIAPGLCDRYSNGNRYNNYGQSNSGNQYGNGNSGGFGGTQNRQQNRYGQGNSGGNGDQNQSGGSQNRNGRHSGGGNGNGCRR